MKLVIVVPKSLGMSPGKLASQVSHVTARVASFRPDIVWETVPTLICETKDHAALYRVAASAEEKHFKAFLYMDSRPTTENTGGEITAMAVFGDAKTLDKVTGKLKLYE